MANLFFKPSKIAVWILPIAIYIVALIFTRFISHQGNCHEWGGLCWSRQDSGLYLEIAKKGHTLFECGPEFGYPEHSGVWCGNAGWAPLYPFFMYLLNKISGIDLSVCGIILSHIFFIAFLIVCSFIIKVQSFKLGNWLTLFLCAMSPGGIYFFAIFPLSLMILLLSLIFYGIQNNRYVIAGISSFLIALSYSSAIVIFFSFGLFLLFLLLKNISSFNLKIIWSDVLKQILVPSYFRNILLKVFVPGMLGVLAMYVYDHFATGHWNAMFLIQGKYGHALFSPFKHLKGHYDLFRMHLYTKEAWINFHNIFFFFAIPVLVYSISKTKEKITPLIMLFVLVIWYIPFCIGMDVSLYRGIGLIAPALAFLHGISNIKKIAILAVFSIFYYVMGVLFIYNILH